MEMASSRVRVFFESAIVFLFFSVPAFCYEECYMYTPAGYQRIGGAYKIGPYASESHCRGVNSDYFKGQGRCDCETIAEPSSSGSSVSSGRTQGAESSASSGETEWELQEQEMLRQQKEMERQRYIQAQAKRLAEEKTRQLEWEQKKQETLSLLKGESGSSQDLEFKSGAGEEVELRPQGTEFFGIPLKGSSYDPGVKTKKLDSTKQLPSSEFENTRRAFWLYQKAAIAKNPEEEAFLISQADEALQGHPLSVVVPPAAKTPQITKEQLRQFHALTLQVHQDKIEVDAIAKERKTLDDKRGAMNERLASLETKIQESNAPIEKKDAETQLDKPKAPKDGQKEQDDILAEMLEIKKNLMQLDVQAQELLSKQKDIQAEFEKDKLGLEKFKQINK